MTPEQKTFIKQVVIPQLASMAIEGTLPSDINELSDADFEKRADKFNSTLD